MTKHQDIYDDLKSTQTTPRTKVVDFANTNIKFRHGILPRAYKLETDLVNIPKTSDFIQSHVDCPVCLANESKRVNISNPMPQKWVKSCPQCGAIVNFFTPQPIQQLIRTTNAKIINAITGYGLGKTTVNMATVFDFVHAIDGIQILVAAATDSSLNTGKDELKKFLENNGKTELVEMNAKLWKWPNGSSVRWMSAGGNDVATIRSWNFGFAVLLEASSKSYYKGGSDSFFNEVRARMRDPLTYIDKLDENGEKVEVISGSGVTGTIEYEAMMAKIVLESNPSATEIMEEVFNKSSVIIGSKNVANFDKVVEKFEREYSSINRDSDIITIMASTRDNKVLPESYEKTNFGGQSAAYIARMRDCDLTRNEDQVFPMAMDHRVISHTLNPMLIQTADVIYQAYDPGLQDPSAILYAAAWFNYTEKEVEVWNKHTQEMEVRYNVDTGPRLLLFDAKKTKGGPTHEGNQIQNLSKLMINTEVKWKLTQVDPKTGRITTGWAKKSGKPGVADKKNTIVRIADHGIWDIKTDRSVAGWQEVETDFDRWEALGFTFVKAFKKPGSVEFSNGIIVDLFEAGILKWSDNLVDLQEEFIRYWYIKKGNGLQADPDNWNHLMDCLKYIAVDFKSRMQGEDIEVLGIDEEIKLNKKVERPIDPTIPAFLQNQKPKMKERPGSSRFKPGKGMKGRR